jgi:putative SOS response-associated peptidase YedK
MCGRYSITVNPSEIVERFDALPPVEPESPRFNAAPTQNLPTLLNDGDKHIQMLRWGLIPHWSKDMAQGNKMINVRVESLTEKPTFKNTLKKRRCLVLADGFYEWRKTADGKIPTRFTLKSGEPFAFAGLWELWNNPEGELVRTFTILTTTPNELVEPVHNRMPVLLLPEHEKIWLNNDADQEDWLKVLKPYPADLMTSYAVSNRINSPGNDDPSLIQPTQQ